MKIVAIGLSHNEADVIQECVRDALAWVDAFILYDNSTDGTDTLARAAGAVVLPGAVNEVFTEGLRQHALDDAAVLNPDWIVRIDPDEFYPRGVYFQGNHITQHCTPQDPRATIESLDAEGFQATRANVVQFWITFHDIANGLLLEDERVSVQQRRRWYTVGHTAVVAWKHDPALVYPPGSRKNIPFYPNGSDVGQLRCAGVGRLIQTHYTCRSLPQLVARIADRKKDRASFGKYTQNLIFDERIGLYNWDGGPFESHENHAVIHEWFEQSASRARGGHSNE